MNQKFSFVLTITFLFVQLISLGQSVTNRERKNAEMVTTDFSAGDCEQNVTRLYEMLDAKDQEIRRSREQANQLIKALVELKRDLSTQNDVPQNSWTAQSDNQTVNLVDHIASERKSNHHIRRHYIRGSRGGCYYINSNGNKTYVDRSFCN